MNQKIIPIVSIVIGVIAFFLTSNYLHMRENEIDAIRKKMEARMRPVRVMVATRSIPQGVKIQATSIDAKERHEAEVPRDSVLLSDGQMILGKKTVRKLEKGQVITWSDIEGGIIAESGLARRITQGLRAVSMSVGGANAVSSLVRPNDRVDVIGTFTMPVEGNIEQMETSTFTILQDVTVLATGQQMAGSLHTQQRGRSASSYSTVTLEVTPAEAELLVFAQQMRGRISLLLRNPGDNLYKKDTPAVDFKYLTEELPRLNIIRQTEIRKNVPMKH